MSWLFSRALVEEYSAATCLDGARSALSSVMPTAHPFLRRGKTTDASTLSRFGQTYAVLTEADGEALLTSFQAGFHARTLALPARAQGSTGSGRVFGLNSHASFARWNQSLLGWKTVQPCLLGGSMSYSGIWPRSGSMRNGQCSEHPTRAFRTKGSACGSSLPTPSGVNGGRNHTMGRIDEWGGSSNPLRGTVIGSMCLPEFEEMVMGWPIGWTEPPPFATDKFREWLHEHGASYMHDSLEAAPPGREAA